MSREATEVLKEALALPAEARAALVDSLLESLDTEVDEDAETQWQRELQHRMAELDSKTVPQPSPRPKRRRLGMGSEAHRQPRFSSVSWKMLSTPFGRPRNGGLPSREGSGDFHCGGFPISWHTAIRQDQLRSWPPAAAGPDIGDLGTNSQGKFRARCSSHTPNGGLRSVVDKG